MKYRLSAGLHWVSYSEYYLNTTGGEFQPLMGIEGRSPCWLGTGGEI
jgi:hypothetical protein